MFFLKSGTKLLLVILTLVGVSCASSNNGTKYEDDPLSRQINQLDGVRVVGSGQYQTVMVSARKMSDKRFGTGWSGKKTGRASTSRKNPPLFIVNGNRSGRDLQRVRERVNEREIKSVNIMDTNNAYSQYRKASYYGVILIETKKNNSKSED